MGSKTGWYLRSVFKKLILCSIVSARTGYPYLTSHTVEQFLCTLYGSWRSSKKPLFNLVSHWIYIKPCQGTFKRMESRLSKLQRLFCSTHNFKPMKSSLIQGWYGSHYHDHWFGLFSKYAKLFLKKFLPSRFNLQYKHNNYTQSLSLSTDCLKIWIHVHIHSRSCFLIHS